ncbi:MAG: hypothetical protein M1536_08315 [Firmicutes bacterium]|nr:hypothetical protein [Bacillota bacterium]
MKRLVLICFVVLLAVFLILPPDAHSKSIRFEIRLVDISPVSNETSMKLRGENETLHVFRNVVVNETDINEALLIKNGENISILIRLKHDSAVKFDDFAMRNRDGRMAVVIDGELIAAPPVPLYPQGQALIPVKLSEKEAKDIVDRLNKE